MLYYLLFWTLLGFIIHFYITFGINLLTGVPDQNCCFLPISEFRTKRISNGVQTEWNLRDRDFPTERDLGGLDPTPSSARGGHEGGGPPLGRAPCLMGPSKLRRRTSSSYIYPRTPKTARSTRNTISTAVTFCIREIPSWSLRRCSAGGGIDHGGLLHQHHSPSDELWVVYHKPLGP